MRECVEGLGVVLKGSELAEEELDWCSGTTEWPVRSVFLSPGSGKVWFYRSTTGRREPCPPAGARRSWPVEKGLEGRNPTGQTRPSGAHCAPGPSGVWLQPGLRARLSERPHLTLKAGFQKRSGKGSGYCLIREDSFPVLSEKKKPLLE